MRSELAWLFDVFTGIPGGAVRRQVEAMYEVVALPGERLPALLEDDLVIRRALGEGGLAQAVEAVSSGLRPGSRLPLDRIVLRSVEGEGDAEAAGPEYVRWVQESLNRLTGAGLVVDGIHGPKTRKAVEAFQARQGLQVDGIVGPRTEEALVAAGAEPPPGSARTPDSPACAGTPARLDRFRHSQATLEAHHERQVEELADRIVTGQVRSVCLVGHTDDSGPEQHNLDLGQRRAAAVRERLAAAIERRSPGLSTRVELRAFSLGERSPSAPNSTPEGRAQNRRVEVFLPRVEEQVRVRIRVLGRGSSTAGEMAEQTVSSPPDLDLLVGETAVIEATGEPLPAGRPAYVWSIADPDVATIQQRDSQDHPNRVQVTARKRGRASLTVTYRTRSGRKATAVSTVFAVNPLSADEKLQLQKDIALARAFVPSEGRTRDLTGNTATDLDILTESTLCDRPEQLGSVICLIPGTAKGSAEFRVLRPEVARELANRLLSVTECQEIEHQVSLGRITGGAELTGNRNADVAALTTKRGTGPIVRALYDAVVKDRMERAEQGDVARLRDSTCTDYELFVPGSAKRGCYSPFLYPDRSRSDPDNVNPNRRRESLRRQHPFVLFAMNLLAEAGIEIEKSGLDALRAVAHVVQTRMARDGSSSTEVITQDNQFSWTEQTADIRRALNPFNKDAPGSGERWVQCLEVAFEAMGGTMEVPPGARGATNYLNPAKAQRQRWENPSCFTGRVGQHCFYRLDATTSCPKGSTPGPNDPFCRRVRGARP